MSNPDARRSPAQARSILTWALPLLAVAAGLVLTVLAWQLARRQVESVQQQRFQRLNERLVSTTEARFASASQLVVSLRAALAAGGAATPAQWSAYVSETEPYFRDGVVGAGYIERVARTEVDVVEQRLRKEFNRSRILRLGGVVHRDSRCNRCLACSLKRRSSGVQFGSNGASTAACAAWRASGLRPMSSSVSARKRYEMTLLVL